MSENPIDVRLGPGGEFDLIRRLLQGAFSAGAAGGAARPGMERGRAELVPEIGPGDDCAVLAAAGWRLAVSIDLSVEGVHFRRDWIEDEEIGFRAATAALSDLAAVAARPVGVLVSLALPSDGGEEMAVRVMEGIRRAADEVGASVLGGDLSRSTAGLAIDAVVLGTTPVPVLRRGASPGDEIWITGRLGAPAAAIEAWRAGREPDPAARAAYASPVARVAEALWLAERGVPRAMIDLSDGLAGDLGHLAAASGVAIVLDTPSVPIHPAARGDGVGAEAALRRGLAGGEDYELCFAAAPGSVEGVAGEFETVFGTALTRIGVVESGAGVWIEESDGARAPLRVAGYSHFEAGS